MEARTLYGVPSQILSLPSQPTVARRWPSGLTAMLHTARSCACNVRTAVQGEISRFANDHAERDRPFNS